MLTTKTPTRALPKSQIEPKMQTGDRAAEKSADRVGIVDHELAMRLRIAVAHSQVSHIRRRLGVGRAVYEAILAGRRVAPVSFLARFCEVLKISPTAILDATATESISTDRTEESAIHIGNTRGILDIGTKHLALSAGK